MLVRPPTRRVVVALTAVLGATAAVAFGLAVLVRPWLTAILPRHPFGTTLLTVLFTACLALFQLRFVRRELLSEVGAAGSNTVSGHPPDSTTATDDGRETDGLVSEATRRDLDARLTRLASAADVRTPTLRLVESSVPNSLSVAGSRAGTVVLSTALVDRLDGDGLDAVLAHELAHLQNRDAAVLTLASFLPAVVAGDYSPVADIGLDRLPPSSRWALGGVAVSFGYGLAVPSLPGSALSVASVTTYLIGLGLTTLAGGVFLGLAATPTVYLTRQLARERELAADRAAARLTGSPASLATALETLGGRATQPRQDARETTGPSHAAHVASLCLLPHGFDPDAESDPSSEAAFEFDDGVIDGFAVETRTHPPLRDRLDALADLAETQESTRQS